MGLFLKFLQYNVDDDMVTISISMLYTQNGIMTGNDLFLFETVRLTLLETVRYNKTKSNPNQNFFCVFSPV